ncbi:MAG TPA: hypothetical protein EYP71_04235 [Dehalococcoidia bacterium]|nr:hypothetical protein [Dehalococcoidia bacterium]
MGIEQLRDLVIIISGLVVTCVFVLIAVLFFLLYNRVRSVLTSVEAITATVREVTSAVKDEVVSPIVRLASFIGGLCQGVDTISSFFKKQKGGG